MKNQEKNVSTKKKILTYYLILAACLLVVAAITVGVIFAVRGSDDLSIDNKPGTTEDDNKPSTPDDNKPANPDDNKPSKPDDKPANTTYEFIFPVTNADVTNAQVFGYDKTMDWYALHDGTDFAAEAGTQVVAAVDGTVTEIAKSDVFYGAYVTIEHSNGVTTVYRFIDPAESLKKGDKVNRGQVIGTIAAATGIENADGAHLHFEIYKDGKPAELDDYLDVNEK